MATTALLVVPRPALPLPRSRPPTLVSSTSTTPSSRSRSGRTIARRSVCIHVHAVRYEPMPSTRCNPSAGTPFFCDDDRDALLFTAPSGGALRYTNWLRRSWYPATIAAGLGQMVEDEATARHRYEGLGFHDLRRASATGLVAAGVDVKTAQSVLGHTDARVTLDLYAQVVTEQQQAAADAMGARFLNSSPRGGRGVEADSDG